jgi:hypothetical protein
MEKRIRILGMSLLVFGFWACDKECNNTCPNPFDSERGSNAEEAAEKTRPLLKQLIDSKNYKFMGFQSVEEVERVVLGKPVTRIRLRCDSLQTYNATKGDNLSPLAMSEQEIFPVLVDKQARAVLVVDSIPEPEGRSKLDWITVSFGNPQLAAIIDSTLGVKSTLDEATRAGYSLVDIPALSLSFFRYPMNDQAVLSLAKNAGSKCWADSLPTTRPLTDVLSVLAHCVEIDNLCSDEHFNFKSEEVTDVKLDSLDSPIAPSPKKAEKKSAK